MDTTVRNGTMNRASGTWADIKKERERMIKKYKEKFEFWSLYYRTEIIWFVVGFVVGAIIL